MVIQTKSGLAFKTAKDIARNGIEAKLQSIAFTKAVLFGEYINLSLKKIHFGLSSIARKNKLFDKVKITISDNNFIIVLFSLFIFGKFLL